MAKIFSSPAADISALEVKPPSQHCTDQSLSAARRRPVAGLFGSFSVSLLVRAKPIPLNELTGGQSKPN
jgi:hypothetical protein